jgi:hypothetical protein
MADLPGLLKPHAVNPHYFADPQGNAVFLTGSHTWANLVDGLLADQGDQDPPLAFDFTGYLDFLERYGHNFIRLWTTDLPKADYSESEWGKAVYYPAPLAWERTGPGMAADGKPKFDLDRLNPAYFERLRSRMTAARDRGIYVSVMLFEGWHVHWLAGERGWDHSPYNVNNNINSINGDMDGDGKGYECHSLAVPALLAGQEAYVREVIDTVNDLDNVLYEIANEDGGGAPARDWQYHMIKIIKEYEAGKPKQHPVGMTMLTEGEFTVHNEWLDQSPADWISPYYYPGKGTDYGNFDVPLAEGKKVVLLDTDHIWGVGGNAVWVWKAFTRGYNPIYMDPYGASGFIEADASARGALGHTRKYADKMDLGAMRPRLDVSSTGHALVNPGREYLVFQPEQGAPFTVDLPAGTYTCEWFDIAAGKTAGTGSLTAGEGPTECNPPFKGAAALYLAT